MEALHHARRRVVAVCGRPQAGARSATASAWLSYNARWGANGLEGPVATAGREFSMRIEMTDSVVFHKPVTHVYGRSWGIVAVAPEIPNWISTTPSGRTLIDLVDGVRDFGAIVREFASREKMDQPKARQYAEFFLRDLLRCGMASLTDLEPLTYPGRARYLEPPALEECWMHVTNRCNLECFHCLTSSGPDGIGGARTELLERAAREAAELGARRFFFTGGEPLLRHDIGRLLELAAGYGETTVLTNGVLLKPEVLRRLDRISPDRMRLQISLDGSSPAINDPIRGAGTFDRIAAGIRYAASSTPYPLTVTTVVSARNLADVPDVTRLLGSLGVRNHHLLWVHRRGRLLQSQDGLLPPSNRQVVEMLSRLLAVSRETGVTIDNLESVKARINGRPGLKRDFSTACYSSLCVYADGSVYPSASFAGFDEMRLGSLHHSSLTEMLRGDGIAARFRSLSLKDKEVCCTCPIRFLCGGGDCEHTFFTYLSENGRDLFSNFLGVDPYCEIYMELILTAMDELTVSRRIDHPSGFSAPHVIHAMGENAVDCAGVDLEENTAEVVAPVRSNCAISQDLDMTRDVVRKFYARAATEPQPGLCCPQGYTPEETGHIPQEVLDMAYGCGSPVSFASLREGESILDLGSGGGIDCFIAAKKVGPGGRVVGLDMTDEMIQRARANESIVAHRLAYRNIEFVKGFLEQIPFEDGTFDVVTSNCVINLSPDKKRVFSEGWRVLKDHGRLVVSDVVSEDGVPIYMRKNPRLWGECISGALTEEEFLHYLQEAGFYGITLLKKSFWKEAEGRSFFSIIVAGYRFRKTQGCVFRGQQAIYHGPHTSVMDEEGHLFPRGVAIEVCTDTAEKLSKPPYNISFSVVDSADPNAGYQCCSPSADGKSCC